MGPFRERNPIPIAIASVVVLLLLLFAAFEAQNLPLIGAGPTYYADFTDATNLQPGADVRLAGVKVGSVTSISLHGTVVQVAFRLKGVTLGDQTTASIQIKTLLGEMYVALVSQGSGTLAHGGTIPVDRTTTPFNVTTAFIGLAQHIQSINTSELAASFNTLAATFTNTPPEVKGALIGLSRLSNSIASRDVVLTDLLAHAQRVTSILAARNTVFTKFLDDGHLILQTVEQQDAVIHALLVNSAALAQQLTALVQENRAALTPALTNLHAVINILSKDQFQLDNTIHLLAPFVRDFVNTIGNGEWFDTIVQNLTGGNLPPAQFRVISNPNDGNTH